MRSSLLALLTAVLTVAVLPATPAQAATPTDGLTPATAAASCWEVKQTSPDAPSGRYWLLTPRLQAPERFHCDQETDGGGWVLVGRGRDGWSNGGDAKGTPAQVSETVEGAAAFSARQLSGTTIDALLDGGRVSSLADGIRVRRAADTAGSRWQELRLSLASRGRWSWALDARHPLARFSVDGAVTTRTQTTADATVGTEAGRMVTSLVSQNGFRRGFNYPSGGPRGSTAPGSHLYSSAAGGGYATPFAQVFVRPRLRSTDLAFTPVPDAGTPAQTAAPLPQSWGLPNSWGVTGQGRGGTDKDFATEVSALAQIGSRIYVGGNFTHVQNGATGQKVAQAYLAAFDASTGAWISSFRPRLNHQVKALAALPNGDLAVGGQFTKVGTAKRVGLAAVKASSGSLRGSWKAQVRQTTGEKMWVRTLAVRGSHLYVGGAFTHVKGAGSSAWRPLRNLARVSASRGAVDSRWAPNLGGAVTDKRGRAVQGTAVLDLSFSPSGKYVYAAGYFQRGFVGTKGRKSVSQPNMAAVTTSKPVKLRSWSRSYSSGSTTARRYQQAVEAIGSRIFVGGSQHSLFGYATSTYKRSSATITHRGGDFQALTSRRGVLYGGCHCADFAFASSSYSGAGAGFTEGDAINYVGAWDAATGAYLPAFSPSTVSRGGEGAWALLSASDGTLWAGGSYTSVVGREGTRQWAGGFVRFPPRPSTAPGAPSGLSGSGDGTSATLQWSRSATAGVIYEVLRGDRVVATTTSTTATVPLDGGAGRFAVRAHDGAGNRSASTPVRTVGS